MTIPSSVANWGVWSANDARVVAQLHTILVTAEERRARSSPSSQERLLATFYGACMDSTRADSDGIGSISATLQEIDRASTPSAIAEVLGRLHRNGVPAAFSFSSEVNRTGDLRYVAIAEQGRLGLSSSIYAGTDSASRTRRQAYAAHIGRILKLAGESDDDARRDADGVIAVEGALARASMSRVQEADATLPDMYRVYTLSNLRAITPGFDWHAYLQARHADAVRSAIVPQPAYMTAMALAVARQPVSDWRAYLRWSVLADASPFLAASFQTESFQYSQRTSGVTNQPPRWQRCVRQTGADMPEILGREYAAREFPPASKAKIAAMVREIRATLIERLRTVTWLTDATRRQSLHKAATFGVKIGYPDQWHDGSGLTLKSGSFVTVRNEARRFESDRLMSRIGQAPDPRQWDFHGQYYFVPQSPTAWANWSEIIFPAAYLQSPLYDSTADIATNYGGIGVVIAHEMTHLFTADGADIDAAGRIRHWWTREDSVRFAALQNRLVKQYDRYTVVDSSTHVNGSLTLGENLADVGGVQLAYATLDRVLRRQRRPARDRLAEERQFFLAYAHARVSKSRPEYLRQQVLSDGHAPSMFRVNGPLSNSAAFSAAFGCSAGDPMRRPEADRVQIW